MPKKKRSPANSEERTAAPKVNITASIPRAGLVVGGIFTVIACVLTFPLIFRMNSSVYGFYDHISTDLFQDIYYYFWWIKEAIVHLKTSPLITPFFSAPFGSHINFVNFTGFVQLPLTILFGHLFSRNFTIFFNLIMSGLGAFFLVRHITKHDGAGIIAGIVFAFCPNMMVRSYTTFDSTQVQWIAFYTLFLIRFIEENTWKTAILAGVFLLCNILFAMPYFLVYLPVHTIVVLAVFAVWAATAKKRGFGGLLSDITTAAAFRVWLKAGVVLLVLLVSFIVYYKVVVGGPSAMQTVQRTTEQLAELSLKPLDYLVPHPRSALLKGNFKESYWDAVDRPEKNSDSDVAYIGYIALVLALLGVIKGRSPARGVFLAGAIVAFWATMGPIVLGLPSPSQLIHIYAPFARRILMYKVFVQLSVAVLAGMGAAFLLRSLKRQHSEIALFAAIAVLMLVEYSLVPPALSVDLRHNPEVYERIRELPDDSMIIEVPLKRMNKNLYQGYLYYQMIHGKALFNPYMDLSFSRIPDHIQPFYRQMEVPMEAQEYCNLAVLRYLGISHLVYHQYIGTMTVKFPAFFAPGFSKGEIDGLSRIFTNDREPDKGDYPGPYDYTFADLYEITAEPCPVALTFDYHSPYDQVPGLLSKDGPTQYGWFSAFYDTTGTFYFPWPHIQKNERLVRMMRQGGTVTATNLSDKPVDFTVSFSAESGDEGREIVVKWNGSPEAGRFVIGPDPVRCEVGPFHLDGAGTGEITIWSTRGAYEWDWASLKISTTAVLSNFRVESISFNTERK